MISHISQPAEAPEKLRSLRPSSAVSSPATNRKRAADGDDGMFSPTSAAAIALSSLHNFGAAREKSLASDLTGVQLFNNNINISNGVTNAHAKYRGTSPVPYGAAPGSFETRNTFAPDTSVAAWGAPPPPGHPGRAAFMAAAQYQSYTQAQQPEIANVTTRLSPTTAQELQYAEKQQRSQYLNHVSALLVGQSTGIKVNARLLWIQTNMPSFLYSCFVAASCLSCIYDRTYTNTNLYVQRLS